MQSPPTASPMPEMLPSYDWASEFRPFTGFHWVVLAICIGSMVAFCIIGKQLLRRDLELGGKREANFRRLLAWSILLTQGFIFARRMVYFDLQDSLPLHMCRLGVWIAAWQLFTLNRNARALTCFWGIGLSAQVFFTPYIKVGYTDLSFYIYWLNHLQIVGCAVYDISVLGYRPSGRDFRFASIWGLVYAAATVGLNALLGTNYSYLGSGQHEGVSLVDKLGPYPQRTIWMSLGALFVFAVILGVSKLAMFVRTKVFRKPLPMFIGPENVPDATLSP
ncbi:MAG: TIGR02206 family membrane protein [Phycisphaerales bacterium JB052]